MSNKKEYRYEYFLSYIGKCDNGNIVNGNLMQKENEKITSVEQIVQMQEFVGEHYGLKEVTLMGITLLKDNGEFGRWTQKN